MCELWGIRLTAIIELIRDSPNGQIVTRIKLDGTWNYPCVIAEIIRETFQQVDTIEVKRDDISNEK